MRSLLARHGLSARRGLGQHFLVDPNTALRIVRLSGVGPHDTVLEIGPGLGSLTVPLAEIAGRVVAIEVDPGVAAALREVVGVVGKRSNVDVIVADALRTDLPGNRLVANLPYNVATHIFARVLEEARAVEGGLVMVQRELGERWTAGPGSKTYGAISVKIAYHADARIVGEVPRTVFLPRPKVSSVLVAFHRRPPPVDVADPPGFFAFVASAFGHRRKTIRNALLEAGLAPKVVEVGLARLTVDPRTRPEQLDIRTFADLFAALR